MKNYVIRLGLRPRRITPFSISIILHKILRLIHSLLNNLLLERLGIRVMKRTVAYMAFRRALSINLLARAILDFVYGICVCIPVVFRYTRRYISFRCKLIQSRCTTNISRHLFFLFTCNNYTLGNRNILAVSLLTFVSHSRSHAKCVTLIKLCVRPLSLTHSN